MNPHLQSIEFCDNCQKRIKRSGLSFDPGYNVLIGPNGSGKSSILFAIVQCKRCAKGLTGRPEYRFFDAEKQNPRTQSYLENLFQVQAMFRSHGQTMQAVWANFPQTNILILDEPETALDIDGIFVLRDKLLMWEGQVIIASHNPILWLGNCMELEEGYRDKAIGLWQNEVGRQSDSTEEEDNEVETAIVCLCGNVITLPSYWAGAKCGECGKEYKSGLTFNE